MNEDAIAEQAKQHKKRKHDYLLALLVFLMHSTGAALAELVSFVAKGHLTPAQAMYAALHIFSTSHTSAAAFGRTLATADAVLPITRLTLEDAMTGQDAALRQIEFFRVFVQEAAEGKYTVETAPTEAYQAIPDALRTAAITARSTMYGESLLATANAAWVAKIVQDNPNAVFIWRAEPNPCVDCAARNGKRYTLATIPGQMGDGSTKCKSRCRCWWEVEGGDEGLKIDEA